MKFSKHLSDVVSIQVGVDLRGGDAFMAKHFLYGAQVCPSLDEVCGKGMPKSMWADVFLNPCLRSNFLDDQKHHHTG